MTERRSDRWLSIVLSVLLHGALAGALVWGWWTYHQRTQAVTPTLAIEATVVDSKSVKGATTPAPQPLPPPPPPEPVNPPPVEPEGPPEPNADELAQRAQQQKEQEEAKEKAAQEAAAKQQEEQQRQAQEKADAERKAKEEAAKQEAARKAEEARLAAQKKLEDEKRKAQEAQEAKELAQNEADLKRSMAAEEHANAVRSSGALASWEAQITQRIERNWNRPPSARAGIVCELDVTQVPGGEVTHVAFGTCNGDQAVRESIEAAVYRASPLPPPPDPSLFERELQITFRPAD